MSRRTYQLNVAREGRWWMVDAPEVGYRTQARSLAEVDEMGRDLISGALDVDPASFDVDICVQRPADVVVLLDAAAQADRQAHEQAARAARERRAAVAQLRRVYRLSALDIARVLGVSRGRVYQLLEDADQDTRHQTVSAGTRDRK